VKKKSIKLLNHALLTPFLGKKTNQSQMNKINTAPNLRKGDKEWVYTDIVREHFFNPRNLLNTKDESSYKADGVGQVGSPACGDVMKVWIKVKPVYKGEELDLKKTKIKECKWQTFGCGSAIASTSIMSEMVTEKCGMSIEKAMSLKAMDINARLGGLPTIKVHCSILGDQALKKAVENYLGKI